MKIVAFDTETYPIGPGEAVAPKVVCITWAYRDENGSMVNDLGAACEPLTKARMLELLLDPEVLLVGHYAAYDLTVLARTWPDLIEPIFKALEAGRVTDTVIREKLLNLSTHGRIESMEFHGAMQVIKYSLADLAFSRLGKDRFADKESPDSWRLRYWELEGIPAIQYPPKAREYALEDAEDTLLIYEAQAQEEAGSLVTEEFHTAAEFALRLMTVVGMRIDRPLRDKLVEELEKELAEEALPFLIDYGILRPSQPPRPYANGACNEDGTPKMVAGKQASINKTALAMHIEEVCKDQGIEVPKTEKGSVSADEGAITMLAPFSPILKEYQKRQAVLRLARTELPKLDADFVYPNFNVLMETGRTSSSGNRKGKVALYPSTNIQQVDPRARQVFIPRDGNLLCSCDYSAIELVCFAQKTFSLFGYSVHRDKVLAGYDLHAYLGAQLARRFDSDFAQLGLDDPDEAYRFFISLKKAEDEELKKFFGKWRKFAKPVGLGYPGGLGAETFVGLAKAAYDIDVTVEEAEMMREVWFETYPEAVDYFKWVNKDCEDPADPGLYRYASPLGMIRAGATYCACANGASLQTPASEGAKLAVFRLAKECWLSRGDLEGTLPVAFIHDEILAEVPKEKAHEAACAIAKIMVDSMQTILPDVKIKAEPCLMERWDKRAESVYKDGRLVAWQES